MDVGWNRYHALRNSPPARWAFLLLTANLCAGDAAAQPGDPRPPILVSPRALQIHRDGPVIDGHNDLPWALRQAGGFATGTDLNRRLADFHTDIPRLRRGGVGAQFWSVYVPVDTMATSSALSTTLEQIDLVREMCRRYPDVFELATSTGDIERIRGSGKVASLIGVEGGHSIENSLGVLRQLYDQGARYMTLTHSRSLPWADSCTGDVISGGLSPFGQEVVREMNRMGMLVDLSHVSADSMRDALEVATAPVIFSHSSAGGIADHPRNVPDDLLPAIQANGGVVMINFYPAYVHPEDAERSKRYYARRRELTVEFPDDPDHVDAEMKRWLLANQSTSLCTVHHVIDHIDHIVNAIGVDHVGLGSDFDGVPTLPKQLEDVSTYPVITQGLLDRGYGEAEIRKVLGENLIRVFRQVEQAAQSEAAATD